MFVANKCSWLRFLCLRQLLFACGRKQADFGLISWPDYYLFEANNDETHTSHSFSRRKSIGYGNY
jgi:hypothetical protein